MAEQPAYDLFVLIDADAPEERRAQIVDDVKKQIAAGDGELKGDADWGVRKLAYEIDHRTEAYYHLFQLEAPAELLNQLEHSLAIDDAVLRHRVIRLPKGAPDRPPAEPSATRQAEPSASRPRAGTSRAREPAASAGEAEAVRADAERAGPAERRERRRDAASRPAPPRTEPRPQPAEQAAVSSRRILRILSLARGTAGGEIDRRCAP